MSQVEESDAGVRVCWDQEGETLILTYFYVFHHGGHFFAKGESTFLQNTNIFCKGRKYFWQNTNIFCKIRIFFAKGESIFPTEWLRDRRWKTEPETSTAR